MKNYFKSSFLLISLASSPLMSVHSHYVEGKRGEYYEYDLEGSGKDQAIRELKHGGKVVLKAPLKACRFISGKTCQKSSRLYRKVRQFFGDSHSINGQRSEVRKALADWESQMHYNDYHHLEERDRQVSLGVIASDSWYLLKSSLYNAGVVLPKESYRTLKATVYGAFNWLEDDK